MWVLIHFDCCPYEEISTYTNDPRDVYAQRKDSMRTQQKGGPSASQGERPQEKPNLPTP